MDIHHIEDVMSHSFERFNKSMFNIMLIFLSFIIVTDDCFSQYIQNYNHLNGYFYRHSLKYNDNDKRRDSLSIGTNKGKKQIIRYKNPHTAAGLAIVPGILLHGAGHWYAGKLYTSTVLFCSSVIGLKLYLSAKDFEEGYDSKGRPFIRENKYYELQKHSGLILWWGTWAYDLIGAPIVCVRHNRRLQEKLSISPYMEYNRFGQQTGIRLSLWF